MKRFCVLAILLFVFLLNLVAQNIVIGESEYSWGFPFRPGFEHWRSASLYTSDEIGHHGTITHLSWRAEDGTFSDPCPLFFPIKIYAKMVEGEVLFPQDGPIWLVVPIFCTKENFLLLEMVGILLILTIIITVMII